MSGKTKAELEAALKASEQLLEEAEVKVAASADAKRNQAQLAHDAAQDVAAMSDEEVKGYQPPAPVEAMEPKERLHHEEIVRRKSTTVYNWIEEKNEARRLNRPIPERPW